METVHNETAITVVCGWCGSLLRHARDTHAVTSHGLCARCARVLDRRSEASVCEEKGDELEHRVSMLICQVYQTRQLLLSAQQRAGADADISARISHALVSVKQQERVLADIQRDFLSGNREAI
jgi:hypothetical protein